MNKTIILLISVLHMFFIHSTYAQSQQYIQKNRMELVPSIFQKVEIPHGRPNTRNYPSLTPSVTLRTPVGDHTPSQIVVAMPKKIIFHSEKKATTIDEFYDSVRHDKHMQYYPIPICMKIIMSNKRVFKYADSVLMVIHIRKTDSHEWFLGEVTDRNCYMMRYPWSFHCEEDIEVHKQRIASAQAYSDDELEIDDREISGGNPNLNLLSYTDDFPFTEGTYELYITMLGLKSYHVFFEIEYRNEAGGNKYRNYCDWVIDIKYPEDQFQSDSDTIRLPIDCL